MCIYIYIYNSKLKIGAPGRAAAQPRKPPKTVTLARPPGQQLRKKKYGLQMLGWLLGNI